MDRDSKEHHLSQQARSDEDLLNRTKIPTLLTKFYCMVIVKRRLKLSSYKNKIYTHCGVDP